MEKLLKSRNCLSLDEIQAYLKGTCSEKERFSVENHLLDCPLCRDAVDGFSQQGKKPKQIIFGLFIAALLITATLSMYFRMTEEQRLFQHFYEPFSIPSEYLSSKSPGEGKELEFKAVELFQNASYAESARLWDQIHASDPANEAALFFSGTAKLEAGKYLEAISNLDAASANPESPFAEEAKWYLAMAFLKTADYLRCKEVLEDISKGNSEYKEEATKLLKEL